DDACRQICVVTSAAAVSTIPSHRRPIWNELLSEWKIRVEFIRPGASSSALIRLRQAQLGDALVIAGGRSGVEHMSDLYLQERKSVIPLDLPLGANKNDGFGGAPRLAAFALSKPEQFIH